MIESDSPLLPHPDVGHLRSQEESTTGVPASRPHGHLRDCLLGRVAWSVSNYTHAVSQLGITLLYLPSCSPSLKRIERPWKLLKRRALSGRYHPGFAEFQAAIKCPFTGVA